MSEPVGPRVVVTLHLHYPELWPELAKCIRVVRSVGEAEVWVTISDPRVAEMLPGDVHVLPVENRGRDVGALFALLPHVQGNFDFWLKLHGKRSPHLPTGGDEWRGLLYASLAGSRERVRRCHAILSLPRIGIVSARERLAFGAHGNWRRVTELSRILRLNRPIDDGGWVSGTMFWARGEVLEAFKNCGLTQADFESEPYPIDGFLAHAWERVAPYYVREKLGLHTVGI